MKESRPARPKNLATKTVAWPWASAVSIHGRSTQASLQPLRSTRQPLQLILLPTNQRLATSSSRTDHAAVPGYRRQRPHRARERRYIGPGGGRETTTTHYTRWCGEEDARGSSRVLGRLRVPAAGRAPGAGISLASAPPPPHVVWVRFAVLFLGCAVVGHTDSRVGRAAVGLTQRAFGAMRRGFAACWWRRAFSSPRPMLLFITFSLLSIE
jgi:hypothetical protein